MFSDTLKEEEEEKKDDQQMMEVAAGVEQHMSASMAERHLPTDCLMLAAPQDEVCIFVVKMCI